MKICGRNKQLVSLIVLGREFKGMSTLKNRPEIRNKIRTYRADFAVELSWLLYHDFAVDL